MADCDNEQECEKIIPEPIKPEPLPKQCPGDESGGGGTSDFNELDNRPKYGGVEMTGSTNIPNLSATVEQLGTNIGNIQNLIPEEATAENQLADKNYVDTHSGGGDGIKFLTAEDYNYPTNNPTSVNPGMLDPGIYFVTDDTVKVYDGSSSNTNRSNEVFIISSTDADPTLNEMMVINDEHGASSSNYKIEFYYVDKANGTASKRGGANGYGVLDGSYVVDNLTTTDAKKVLSANQGKALRDMITKTPYYISVDDLPAVGSEVSNKSLYISRSMGNGDKTNGQYFFNILGNIYNDHNWKLIVVNYNGSGKDLELFVTSVEKPSLNAVSPSASDNAKADFAFYDGTATRTLRIWSEGTGANDFHIALY